AHVSHPGAGGLSLFVGVVRDENDGRQVSALEYHAYEAMAKSEMARIAGELEREFAGVRLAALHRVGRLAVGEVAVVCAAGAPHRGEAFAACRALIDRIKADVPIWKREWGPEGPLWVGWVDARCAGGEAHEGGGHHHGTGPRGGEAHEGGGHRHGAGPTGGEAHEGHGHRHGAGPTGGEAHEGGGHDHGAGRAGGDEAG
ncbi:MAG TPA: molybdenum cofactor biosynthesis protein MoaE, partial [Polyangiaceae bacterium]|nr:molybdenum cofactor biosynthesis protein MoaE [Polyangiaceae bacterium]